jgi:hypothetical protein
VLWLFGGERAGAPVAVIQRVDVSSHRAIVAGHLPAPLGEATAVVLDGRIYIARVCPRTDVPPREFSRSTLRRQRPMSRRPCPHRSPMQAARCFAAPATC